MPVLFTRQPHERTSRLRKEFKHNKVAQQFLMMLYQKGYLDRIKKLCPLEKIARGKVPKNFDIHHIVPLSGGGTNDLHNLCLIERPLHKFINRRCFDPALKDIQPGQTVEINVPDFPPVALYKDYGKFIQETLAKENRESGFKHVMKKPLQKLPLFFGWRK